MSCFFRALIQQTAVFLKKTGWPLACLLLTAAEGCLMTGVHKDPDVSEAYRIFLENKKSPTPAKFFTDQYPVEHLSFPFFSNRY